MSTYCCPGCGRPAMAGITLVCPPLVCPPLDTRSPSVVGTDEARYLTARLADERRVRRQLAEALRGCGVHVKWEDVYAALAAHDALEEQDG